METQLGFAAKETAARHAIAQVGAIAVDSRDAHFTVGAMIDVIRKIEKDLENEYSELPIIREAKRLQGIKTALAKDLEAARKSAKARLLAYEDHLEAERIKAERIAQAEAVRLAEAATIEAAAEAEASGDNAQAEAIINEPIVAAVVVVPEEKLKAKGHTRRRVYKARIIDPSIVPDEYWTLDTSKIEATIRARKEEGQGVIPGVLAYSEVV